MRRVLCAKEADNQCASLAGLLVEVLAALPTDTELHEPSFYLQRMPRRMYNVLERDNDGHYTDIWGRPLVVTFRRRGDIVYITVLSRGRDGELGTPDDFTRVRQARLGSAPEAGASGRDDQ
jgi:hypothetical protein